MDLNEYLRQFVTSNAAGQLSSAFGVTKKVLRKEYLISPGQQFPYLAFIKKGVFRVYFINEQGIEITTWFSFAGMMITDMMAYYQQTSTTFYVHALADSEIILAHRSDLEVFYEESTQCARFGRLYAEKALLNVMHRMLDFQTKTAEERYLDLLAKPEFMQKIPLKHLASYLGITDSSLSRIRAQVNR